MRWLDANRFGVQYGADALAWAVAVTFATTVRYNFDLARIDWFGVGLMLPLAALAQLVAGLASGLYIHRWRFGSFDEVAALARAAALATAVVFALDLWLTDPHLVPISATLAGGIVALVLMAGMRYAWRLALEVARRPGEQALPTIVFGAGDGGAQVISAMLHDPTSPLVPVALLDDSPYKQNLRISGVPVMGGRQQVATAAERTDAEVLLIAIPSAGSDVVADLTARADEVGLEVKVLPPVSELFGPSVGVTDIRDVTDADLLGRHEIHTDVDSIAGYLAGKRILVTGAGGSIGGELCRQIWRFAPSELIMLDRDESGLQAVQLSLDGRGLLDSPDLVLVDIRDRPALLQVFEQRRPQVVFHCAALKHLPLLELNPAEAVKSNVWGTQDVLDASAAVAVERFVNISTDKAADPVSVLGYTKRIAERLTAHMATRATGTYLSVRFGNVLGSRGSVLNTFHTQIAAGGPVTVTHEDTTRYFMTVEEAVELTVQAGAIGRPGEVLVLDMGDPVRISDVARLLAARAERSVEVTFTGLRPGEKLHEQLLGEAENDVRPVHPLISHVAVPPLEPNALRDLSPSAARPEMLAALRAYCHVVTARHPS